MMREQCSRIEELLIASTLHEISESDRKTMEEHLAECPKCRQYHLVLQEDDRRLSAYVKATEPVIHNLEDRVMKNVKEHVLKIETRKLWIQRNWIRYAAAAVVILAIGSFFLFDLGGGSGVAWADVIQRIIEAQDYICRMEKRGNFGKDLNMVQYCSGTYGIRQDLYVNDRNVASVYIHPEDRRLVTLIHESRQYIVMELSEDDFERALAGSSPRSFVEGLRGEHYSEIGSRQIDGIMASGIETNSSEIGGGVFEENSLKLWVDDATEWPVRLEFEGKADNGDLWSTTIMYDFTWNAKLEAEDFAYTIPEDYEDVGTLERSELNEESAIEGLRWYGTFMKGIYPKRLVFALIVREFEKEEPRLRSEGIFDDGDVINFLTIQRTCQFMAELEQNDKDPAYYGETVQAGDFDKVLMRWRLDDDSYRVVFGDLRTETLTQDQLRELEES